MNWGSMDEGCQLNVRNNFVTVKLDLAAWWVVARVEFPITTGVRTGKNIASKQKALLVA